MIKPTLRNLTNRIDKLLRIVVIGLSLGACTSPLKTPPPSVVPPPVASQPFVISTWASLPDWQTLDLVPTRLALLQSCRVLKTKPQWQDVCTRAEQLTDDNTTLRAFYQEWFTPYQVLNPDGTEFGMITGYYEPLLKGSRVKSQRFRFPLYSVPDDLVTIDLATAYPQLKDMRLRGRVQGKRVIPYYNRAEIEALPSSLKGKELFWVENAVELFFLQIQGSGRIDLPDGTQARVGYAEQNGHPYVSIGKKLVEMGELKLEQASMQGIKEWAERSPEKLNALLELNPSYVFFREMPDSLLGPLGALGVPLTDGYSMAIDARTVPLGSPVFLATTYPNDSAPLNRLMLAQDTGGAIRGAVRGDFFWGFGEAAGTLAGRMKQQGRLWVLFPKGAEPFQK